MQKWIFICTLFLVSGLTSTCENQESDLVFYCRTDRVYRVNKNLSFTIESVQDYRCPKGVVCIWAGDVDVHLKIEYLSLQTDTMMRLNDRRSNPIHVAGYVWKVLDVAPYPDINQVNEIGEHFVWMQLLRD